MGTPEAMALGVRLSVWHDAMVAHERRLRSSSAKDRCHDECPHVEARALWAEALDVFGPRAHELTFLRSRGHGIDTSADRVGAVPVDPLRVNPRQDGGDDAIAPCAREREDPGLRGIHIAVERVA